MGIGELPTVGRPAFVTHGCGLLKKEGRRYPQFICRTHTQPRGTYPDGHPSILRYAQPDGDKCPGFPAYRRKRSTQGAATLLCGKLFSQPVVAQDKREQPHLTGDFEQRIEAAEMVADRLFFDGELVRDLGNFGAAHEAPNNAILL